MYAGVPFSFPEKGSISQGWVYRTAGPTSWLNRRSERLVTNSGSALSTKPRLSGSGNSQRPFGRRTGPRSLVSGFATPVQPETGK